MRFILGLLLFASPAFGLSDLAIYTLLSPSSHSFELSYETSVTRAGVDYFFNPVRPGSTVSKESAFDLATGKTLELKTATGREAKAAKAAPADTPDNAQFLWVKLAHPVGKGAETRIRILRTYVDAASYKEVPGGFVFERPMPVTRNVVLLPAGYELTGSRSPAIVTTERDGRIRISFFNDRDDELPVRVEGRKLP
ncbi:MAG TPA: hypothetical protein VHW24_25850 [Bryobacteraceae bacterium]|jgi:hypothetical protein|nr:hypothetical protein [Bryobacteraceae bacterium]